MADVLPLIGITTTAMLLLLIEALLRKSETISYWTTLLGLVVTGVLSAGDLGRQGTAFHGMVSVGGIGSYFSIVVLLSALFTTVFSRTYIERARTNFGEWYLLIVFATAGMMLIAQAADFMILFLGIELMSIALYVLAGFIRLRLLANEASLKYFLLGAFATGFLLYGIALMYGVAGTTSIGGVIGKFPALASSTLFWCGAGLFITGLAFKVGAVPFHMWIPDVYQGSPTPISGFMATGAKTAAFSAFLLMFGMKLGTDENLKLAFSLLAAGSMILGNIVAIAQSNLKRMLAYSSIAHAGYMMVGVASGNAMGQSGIAFYAASYLFMNIGAFGILAMFESEDETHLTYDEFAGFSARNPAHAALLSVFMFSLAGIPPFGGFIGKYYMFVAAIDAGLTWLAILGVLTSLISVYYYLRLVMIMYFRESAADRPGRRDRVVTATLILAAIATLILGVYPSPLLSVIQLAF